MLIIIIIIIIIIITIIMKISIATGGTQRAYKKIRPKTAKHPKSKDVLTH